MRSVENEEWGKWGVWKMRSVENAECIKRKHLLTSVGIEPTTYGLDLPHGRSNP